MKGLDEFVQERKKQLRKMLVKRFVAGEHIDRSLRFRVPVRVAVNRRPNGSLKTRKPCFS